MKNNKKTTIIIISSIISLILLLLIITGIVFGIYADGRIKESIKNRNGYSNWNNDTSYIDERYDEDEIKASIKYDFINANYWDENYKEGKREDNWGNLNYYNNFEYFYEIENINYLMTQTADAASMAMEVTEIKDDDKNYYIENYEMIHFNDLEYSIQSASNTLGFKFNDFVFYLLLKEEGTYDPVTSIYNKSLESQLSIIITWKGFEILGDYDEEVRRYLKEKTNIDFTKNKFIHTTFSVAEDESSHLYWKKESTTQKNSYDVSKIKLKNSSFYKKI